MIARANLVEQRGEGVEVGSDDHAVVVLDGESPRSRVLGMAAGGHGGCPWLGCPKCPSNSKKFSDLATLYIYTAYWSPYIISTIIFQII